MFYQRAVDVGARGVRERGIMNKKAGKRVRHRPAHPRIEIRDLPQVLPVDQLNDETLIDILRTKKLEGAHKRFLTSISDYNKVSLATLAPLPYCWLKIQGYMGKLSIPYFRTTSSVNTKVTSCSKVPGLETIITSHRKV